MTVLVAAFLCLVAACSTGTSSGGTAVGGKGTDTSSSNGKVGIAPQAGGTPSTQPGVASTLPEHAKGKLVVRFFNNITVGGKPGPAIDIYDDLLPSQTATSLPKGEKPIVSGLAYGEFSSYVTPQVMTAQGSTGQSEFTALPAGTKPSVKNPLVTAGVLTVGTSPPQETMFLSGTATDPDEGTQAAGPLTSGGNGLTYGGVAEKKGGQQDEPPSSAPSGKAVFLIDTSLLPDDFNGASTFFFVDDSCSPAANGVVDLDLPSTAVEGGGASKFGPLAYFPVDPGSHQIALTSSSTGMVPTCDEIKPTSSDNATTVSVSAGDSVLVLPYGIDKAHIKIATGVIN